MNSSLFYRILSLLLLVPVNLALCHRRTGVRQRPPGNSVPRNQFHGLNANNSSNPADGGWTAIPSRPTQRPGQPPKFPDPPPPAAGKVPPESSDSSSDDSFTVFRPRISTISRFNFREAQSRSRSHIAHLSQPGTHRFNEPFAQGSIPQANNFLIELDIQSLDHPDLFNVAYKGDNKIIFTAIEPYLFRIVRRGEVILWLPKSNEYPYKVVCKKENGKNIVKTFFPQDKNSLQGFTPDLTPRGHTPQHHWVPLHESGYSHAPAHLGVKSEGPHTHAQESYPHTPQWADRTHYMPGDTHSHPFLIGPQGPLSGDRVPPPHPTHAQADDLKHSQSYSSDTHDSDSKYSQSFTLKPSKPNSESIDSAANQQSILLSTSTGSESDSKASGSPAEPGKQRRRRREPKEGRDFISLDVPSLANITIIDGGQPKPPDSPKKKSRKQKKLVEGKHYISLDVPSSASDASYASSSEEDLLSTLDVGAFPAGWHFADSVDLATDSDAGLSIPYSETETDSDFDIEVTPHHRMPTQTPDQASAAQPQPRPHVESSISIPLSDSPPDSDAEAASILDQAPEAHPATVPDPNAPIVPPSQPIPDPNASASTSIPYPESESGPEPDSAAEPEVIPSPFAIPPVVNPLRAFADDNANLSSDAKLPPDSQGVGADPNLAGAPLDGQDYVGEDGEFDDEYDEEYDDYVEGAPKRKAKRDNRIHLHKGDTGDGGAFDLDIDPKNAEKVVLTVATNSTVYVLDGSSHVLGVNQSQSPEQSSELLERIKNIEEKLASFESGIPITPITPIVTQTIPVPVPVSVGVDPDPYSYVPHYPRPAAPMEQHTDPDVYDPELYDVSTQTFSFPKLNRGFQTEQRNIFEKAMQTDVSMSDPVFDPQTKSLSDQETQFDPTDLPETENPPAPSDVSEDSSEITSPTPDLTSSPDSPVVSENPSEITSPTPDLTSPDSPVVSENPSEITSPTPDLTSSPDSPVVSEDPNESTSPTPDPTSSPNSSSTASAEPVSNSAASEPENHQSNATKDATQDASDEGDSFSFDSETEDENEDTNNNNNNSTASSTTSPENPPESTPNSSETSNDTDTNPDNSEDKEDENEDDNENDNENDTTLVTSNSTTPDPSSASTDNNEIPDISGDQDGDITSVVVGNGTQDSNSSSSTTDNGNPSNESSDNSSTLSTPDPNSISTTTDQSVDASSSSSNSNGSSEPSDGFKMFTGDSGTQTEMGSNSYNFKRDSARWFYTFTSTTTTCTTIKFRQRQVWRSGDRNVSAPRTVSFNEKTNQVTITNDNKRVNYSMDNDGNWKFVSETILSSNLKLLIQDPKNASKNFQLGTSIFKPFEFNNNLFYHYDISGHKCIEVKYKDTLIWKYDPTKSDVLLQAISWHELFTFVILQFTPDLFKVYRKVNSETRLRFMTLKNTSLLDKDKVKLFTKEGNDLKEMDSNLYEFKDVGYAFEYFFKENVECHQLKYENTVIYEFKTDYCSGKFPNVIYLFSNKAVHLIFGTDSIHIPADTQKGGSKAIDVNIKDTKDTDKFKYTKNNNNIATYTAINGFRFQSVSSKKTSGSFCCRSSETVNVWTAVDENDLATKVVVKGKGDSNKKLAMHLFSGSIVNYAKGNDGAWKFVSIDKPPPGANSTTSGTNNQARLTGAAGSSSGAGTRTQPINSGAKPAITSGSTAGQPNRTAGGR